MIINQCSTLKQYKITIKIRLELGLIGSIKMRYLCVGSVGVLFPQDNSVSNYLLLLFFSLFSPTSETNAFDDYCDWLISWRAGKPI